MSHRLHELGVFVARAATDLSVLLGATASTASAPPIEAMPAK
ncbi:MAG: hypothetical protein ABI034_04285 [Nakamurella sp.]